FIKKDLGLKEIKTVTYHRSGEYKNNIYSSVSGSPTINLVNIDFSAISMEAPTLFMYLWMP
ncbi:MAG: signal peptide peptidase SppA, partial [Nitrospinales bacterium]